MRASITRYAVFAITILALSGCRGGMGSYSPWRWGRKNPANSNMSTPSEGPALPSASATPGNYGSTAQTATTPGYPDQTAAAYQPPASPGQAAASGGQAAAYPGQAAGYNNVAPTGMPNAAAPGGYGAMPNAADASPVAAAPQNGLYNEGYGQTPVAQASTDQNAYQSPQGGAYQTPAATDQGYAPQGQAYAPPGDAYAPQGQAYAPPSSDPYVNNAQPPAANYAQPAADSYAQPQAGSYAPPADGFAAPAQAPGSAYATADASNGAYPSSDGQYANNRYSTDSSQPEQATADRYADSSAEPAVQPAAEQAASGGDRYQPSSAYNPGQTGYSPPGVAPYQTPAQPNTVPSPRRDPYYRPGGTSDYSTGAVVPAAATTAAERYATPPVNGGANPNDRYAPPAGANQLPGSY